MISGPVNRLRGMRDLQEEEYLRLRRVQDSLQGVFSSHGYRIVEPPFLEPAETFVRKAGGELASRMYTFQEPGGHIVSLRPEFTSAVTRIFREHGQQPLPVRWQYAGPVFRYYPEEPDRPRQFWQVGLELLGAGGPQADAEVIALAARSLGPLDLPGVRLVLSDMGLMRAFLGHFGVSERAQRFLLRNLCFLRGDATRLREVRERAASVGLLRTGPSEQELPSGLGVLAQLNALDQTQSAEDGNASSGHFGSRTSQEVASRLQHKLRGSDDAQRFDRALDMVYHLAQISGDPSSALGEATRLVHTYQADAGPTTGLARVLDAVQCHQLGRVAAKDLQVDFALAHSIAYYTGVVFELRSLVSGSVLGAGGRYDGLLGALGAGEDVPAIGFSIQLDALMEDLKAGDGQRPYRKAHRVLVVPATLSAYGASLKVADTLRLGGEVVEQSLVTRTVAEHREYARAKGIEAVVLVGEGGEREQYVVEEV